MRFYSIATAPKDGTKILLAKISDKRFCLDKWKEVPVDTHIAWACAGFWSEKWKNWNDGIEPAGLADPTHWAPFEPLQIDNTD